MKVNVGAGSDKAGRVAPPVTKASTSPVAKAASTARAGFFSRTSRKTATIGKMMAGKFYLRCGAFQAKRQQHARQHGRGDSIGDKADKTAQQVLQWC